MEAEFEDKALDQLETDPKFTAGFQASIVSAFRKLIHYIRQANDERDFYFKKSLRFEKLTGKRAHQHSMRLNDQYRLIVELKGKGPEKIVHIIEITDYH